MNKKLEGYKRKFDKLIKTFEMLFIFILILGIVISIVQYTMNKLNTIEEPAKAVNADEYIINLQDDVIYNNNLVFTIDIVNFNEKDKYKAKIKLDDENNDIEQELSKESNIINIQLKTEGQRNFNIIIYKNDVEVFNNIRTIYYIKPYEKQFLDELGKKGIVVHYRDGTMENYKKDIDLLKNIGIKYIRTDFIWRAIDKGNNVYDFTKYDEWIEKVGEANIKIIAILLPNGTIAGEDMKINNSDELERFVKFVEKISERYPQIVDYEIYNEPNLATEYNGGSAYISNEYIEWYGKAVEAVNNKLKQINNKINVISGATAMPYSTTSTVMESKEFFNKIFEYGVYKNSQAFSYHPYDTAISKKQNTRLKELLDSHNNLFNNYGGFIKTYITEYGISTFNGITEDIQAQKIIQQSVILDQRGIDTSIIYDFWNSGNNSSSQGNNYGLINHNYTPKL